MSGAHLLSGSGGAIWYVHSTAAGSNNGHSWSDAFIELQSALAVAQEGDQIWVAQGTYLPDYDVPLGVHTADRSAAFRLVSGVSICGGFDGTETDLEQRAGLFDQTVLSGDIGVSDFADDNAYHVIVSEHLSVLAVVDGVTIANGRAHPHPNHFGGGVFSRESDLAFRSCTFRNNHATYGGAISHQGHPGGQAGSLVVDSCLFEDNDSDYAGGAISNGDFTDSYITGSIFQGNISGEGGAIWNSRCCTTISGCIFDGNDGRVRGGGIQNTSEGAPSITNCSFHNNFADYGGAIHDEWASPSITDCFFSNNIAYWRSGAIENDFYSSPTVRNCSFVGNVSFVYGGAIGNSYLSTPRLIACEFRDNQAGSSGGAIDNSNGSIWIKGSRFEGNSAGAQGGALLSTYGSIVIQSSTFVGNKSDTAGAIATYTEAALQNCTFANNITTSGGTFTIGDMYDARFASSIFWDNLAPLGLFRGQASIRYSLVQGGYPGEGNSQVPPAFVSAPDAGDDGWGDDPATPFVDEGANDDFGDLRLQPASPGINAGDPDFVPETGESDLDGHARVLCGRVDMGAYEFGIGDVNCDRAVDLGDFAAWPPCSLSSAPPLPTECVPLDFDNDEDVDLVDFASLQRLNWIK